MSGSPAAPLTRDALREAVPDRSAPRRLPGLEGRVDVWRDAEGTPHVRATTTPDAFFGQGWVHAQDRLWHMEYDRRRAQGRWAECAGPAAVSQDTLMRRLGIAASARADHAAVGAAARAMLEAFAAGVNAFVRRAEEGAEPWPVEFRLLDLYPEAWQPWDSLAVFKVRHVEMGPWQAKLWRARLVRHLGAERAAALCPGTPPNLTLIVPPGAVYEGPAFDGRETMQAAADYLARTAGWEQGSNSWALDGARTGSGQPLVAGDPHRALEVPNVYYPNHLACPEFDAVGLAFPGVPGLPHFGHNRAVAWCVTHAMADVQDLYLERFDAADPRRYAAGDGWRVAEVTAERIAVRGAPPVAIEVTVTHHGPVVLGDPRQGAALAFRSTATVAPNRTLDAFVPMLRAETADALEMAMRPWVDPVNNLVFADVHGAIGYRTRGQVPLRVAANAWVPVPGWDGAHEWRGTIPFEQMPAFRNPAAGFIATANSRIAGADYPHDLGIDVAHDARTRRLVARLEKLEGAEVPDMAAIHADRRSGPAVELIAALAAALPAGPDDACVAWARRLLLAWDGSLDGDSAPAAIYAAFRERLMRDLLTPLLGPLAPEAFAGAPRGGVAHATRLRARLGEWIASDDRRLLPPGAAWPETLARAFAGALAELGARLGADPAGWRWDRLHRTEPRHPLSAVFPEAAPVLDPPAVGVGGDADTLQCAGYVPGAGFGVALTSVARYVFDLADWERSAWIVPFGVSGHPGSPHYVDQLDPWSAGRLVPMRYDWTRIIAEAVACQALTPDPS